MRVIILYGSPKAHGNSATALHEVERTLQQQGLETERDFNKTKKRQLVVSQRFFI